MNVILNFLEQGYIYFCKIGNIHEKLRKTDKIYVTTITFLNYSKILPIFQKYCIFVLTQDFPPYFCVLTLTIANWWHSKAGQGIGRKVERALTKSKMKLLLLS